MLQKAKHNFLEILVTSVVALALLAFLFLTPYFKASAGVSYPPAALLQPGDITSGMIRDGVILNEDVSSTAAIGYGKLNLTGSLLDADVSSTAAIAATKIATSSANQFVTNGTQTWTGSKTFGTPPIIPTSTPAGDTSVVSKYYVDNRSVEVSMTATAGENLSQNDAVIVGVASTSLDVAVDQTSLTGATMEVGGTTQHAGGGGQIAQSFQVAATTTVDVVAFYVLKFGTPADNLIFQIRADNAGEPAATSLASSSIAGGTILATNQKYITTLSNSVTLSPNTTYWLWWHRSGAESDANRFTLTGTTTNAYASGSCNRTQGGAWQGSCTAVDLSFEIAGNPTIPKVYKASGANTTSSMGFVGFAKTSASSGNTLTVVTNGTVSNFTSLTYGLKYYLSDTRGAIATTPGTSSTLVGVAVTTSTLLIK